jgi:hypothetical protein
VKLIGAGLPRTGTMSRKLALEMLGFGPCYHMFPILNRPELARPWRRALDGDVDWGTIFDGCQSTLDWPGAFFYRELMEAYPDAKVLLGVREGDSWARSMRDTIWGSMYGDSLIRHLSDARCAVDPDWNDYIELMKEMWARSGLLNGESTTDEFMVGAIQRYQEEVQQTVPSERLLVWSLADGWEPLCEFLEVPVPEEPFPHVNSAQQFGDWMIDSSLAVLQEWRAGEGREQPARSAVA